MGFKLGSEKRKYHTPENTPVIKKNLKQGVVAEANNDGTVFMSKDVEEGSPKYNQALKHELKHMNDMASGKAQYGENWVGWEGNIFFRRNINGEMMIDGPAGRLPEGHPDHPLEEEAIASEWQDMPTKEDGQVTQ